MCRVRTPPNPHPLQVFANELRLVFENDPRFQSRGGMEFGWLRRMGQKSTHLAIVLGSPLFGGLQRGAQRRAFFWDKRNVKFLVRSALATHTVSVLNTVTAIFRASPTDGVSFPHSATWRVTGGCLLMGDPQVV